jgi:predicted ATPase
MAIGLSADLSTKLSAKIGKKPDKDSPKIDPALDQEKIFEQYSAVLKALTTDRTLILILDDLQWADSGSINLLFHLVRQLKDSRLMLVGTYRPDDVALGREGKRHPLESIINELKRYYGDILIDLAQTENREGRTFVNALVDAEPNHLDPGFRDELFAHTGGQPLFTVELLRNLQERGDLVKDEQGSWILGKRLDWKTLPARIEGVVGERIARLPGELRETLSIGSVIGEEFSAQAVAHVQKISELELVRNLSQELEKCYLLVVEQGEIRIGKKYLSQYRFTHAMIQQYLYNELSTGERRILHGEIAQTLEELYGDQADEIAMQLARHYEAAGNEDKAIAYLITVGDNALRGYAYDEAINAYTRSLALGEQAGLDGTQLSHIYLRRGRALEFNKRYEMALENYARMLADAQNCQDREMELEAKLAACTLYSIPTPVADADKGKKLSEECLELARDLGNCEAEAKVLWNLQLVYLLQNKTGEAIEYGEKSLAMARELNLREQMAYTLSDLGWAYGVACQFEKAQVSLEEGAVIWKELDNKPMLSNNLNTSLFCYYWTGKDAEVLRVAEECYQISSSIKEVWNQASARMLECLVWFGHGEIDQALGALEEAIQLASGWNQNYTTWYRAIQCRIFGELGAIATGTQLYQTYRVANPDVPHAPMRTDMLVSYALFEIASGQPDTATATLDSCEPDAPPWEAEVRLAKCRLAMAREDFTNAAADADAAIGLMRQYTLVQFLPEALYLKGKCQYVQGDISAAKSTLGQARNEAEHLGLRRIQWQILALLAQLEPDTELSEALKAEAIEIVKYIAGHITSESLRNAFVHSAELRGVKIHD